MKMAEVKEKAKSIGVTPGKMKKSDLIRTIQSAEGYPACYGSSTGTCPHTDCCFYDDCEKES